MIHKEFYFMWAWILSVILVTIMAISFAFPRLKHNEAHLIKFYSGGLLIKEWISSGRVIQYVNEIHFTDSQTKDKIIVTGDTIVIDITGK